MAQSNVNTSVSSNLKSTFAQKPASVVKLVDNTSSNEESYPESPTKNSSGVFSVLITSQKENEAWKEAAVAENHNFRPTKTNDGRRQAPFYNWKVMRDMPITFNAFRYGAIPNITTYLAACVSRKPQT
jgi:DNA cross-link repair 1A protein